MFFWPASYYRQGLDQNEGMESYLGPAQGQQGDLPPGGPNSFSSEQPGCSQVSWHLGLGHKVGVLHFQAHLVFSQRGAQLGSGAVQVVLQTAGRQTVSQAGQSSISHISLGHLTEQTGSSQ